MAAASSSEKILIKRQAGPDVDEAGMSRFAVNDYLAAEVFGVSEGLYENKKHKKNQRYLPPHPSIDASDATSLPVEPHCDITKSVLRIKPMEVPSGNIGKREFVASGIVHLGLVGATVLASFVASKHFVQYEIQPVELVFGIESEIKNIPDAAKLEAPAAQPEALKLPETLPQLPKQIALPSSEELPDAVPLPQTPTPAPTTVNANIPTPLPGVKTMAPEEIVRRMEKENRKVGEQERTGTNKPSTAAKAADVKFDLPPPPISQPVANAETGTSPVGSLQGRVNATVKDAYQIAAFNHVKRIWRLPNTGKYGSSLATVVSIDIDTFGKIIGTPEIVTPSGNAEYDEEVVAVVTNGQPYPDLPAELAPRMRLRIRLSPGDVTK